MLSSTARADISATAAEVWAALTSPAQTQRYLASLSITSAWQPDARVDAHHGTTLVATGTVVVADSPSLLVYRLENPQTGDIDCWLDWHLDEAEPGTTRVTLTADTLPADPPVDVVHLLSSLKTYLETVKLRPGPSST
ncbi:MAG TPA: SRPBCC domain-containing protein [Streptosporangiaceae bacterium]|jgi:uncharacterized protein YndB with AHSA1/START domain